MNLAILALLLAIACAAIMTVAWRVAVSTGKTGWIDVVWTFGVGITGAAAAFVPVAGASSFLPRQILVAVLVAAWSLRLGSHIAARTLKNGDDPRYRKFIKEWGGDWRGQLFRFLQIQAAVMLLLALSVMAAAHNPPDALRWQDWLGVAILVAAVVGEAVADRQLARFAANPANKGKVCDVGLWSWSRHPNYFFEWLGWVAYPVIAIDLTGNYWWGLASLVAPAMMYWLLAHVSGVPPLEEHMLKSRGDAFRAYQRRVSAFFPAPPKTQEQR